MARSRCQQSWLLLRPLSSACRCHLVLCPHTVFHLCTHAPGVFVSVLISFYKDTSHTGPGLTLTVSFELNHSFQRPGLQIQSYSEGMGLRASTCKMGEGA